MPEVAACPVDDCNLSVDVVLKSSDGELFGAHQRNLEIYTGGFPITGSTVVSEPVSLEESADVLRLLLRYTHNTRLPNLDTTPFTLLASLAEAVEKYMIYSAMENCRTHMKRATDQHPIEVFFYSVKHNYPDLADQAAKLTLSNSPWHFVDLLRGAGFANDIVARWLRYHSRWMEILVQLPTFLPEESHRAINTTCYKWSPFKVNVFGEISGNPGALEQFSNIISKHHAAIASCVTCQNHCREWASMVGMKIEKLPKYSEVL